MRKLTYDEVRSVAQGTAYIEEQEDRICFHRFTKEQEALYRTTDFGAKPLSTAGVRLCFETDSCRLRLAARVLPGGSSRSFFAFDVLVNGKNIASIHNYPEKELPEPYWSHPFPLEAVDRTMELGAGRKEVEIYFPWSVLAELFGLYLDRDATLRPLKRPKRFCFFGDSITHGYDALHPSLTWPARLCRELQAEEINKAIGGEKFFPELAALPDPEPFDCILVAYGTNDWKNRDRDSFLSHGAGFFRNLCRSYPDTPVRVVMPIWRGDADQPTACGAFEELERLLPELTHSYPMIRCIRGMDLLPHDTALFSDGYLHPREEGFAYYAQNLKAAFAEFRS